MAYRDGISRCFFSVTFFLLLLILPANMTPIVSLNGMSHRSDVVVSELGRRGMIPAGTPHDSIAIDGDTNFTETALREGWPGNGSPEHPFIIDGLEIDCSGEFRPCISIRNTRSNFIISNCRLIGAGRESGWDAGVGIYLENVWYGEMVENIVEGNNQGIYLELSNNNNLINNTCNSNGGYNGEYDEWGEEYDAGGSGIRLHESYSNTVTNNTCSGNGHYGIRLESAQQNTVANNTFNRNDIGISLQASDFNTLANNTCSSNTEHGISVRNSHNNTVISNTCNSNDIGIFLRESNNNTVANNICNNNRIGIELYESYSNIVANNTFVGNIEHDIVEDFEPEWGLDPVVLLLMGLVGITVLGVAWRETYRAYVSEGKKWREAHSEERTLPKADQEVLLAEERRRRALKEMYRDEINIPLGYRVVSWFGKRRALKHVDVDESLEDDSSDQ